MRVAVVGHVEWVQFARVERVPSPGEIVHAGDHWEEPAGGGAVTAVQLARLAGAAELFTAFGDDELGRRAREELTALGLRVHALDRPEPQRRAFTFLDDDGERTITVIGRRLVPQEDDPLPWERLDGVDAVYVTGGDAGAVRAARRARVLVATPRTGEQTLVEAGVALDALVGSAEDPGEHLPPDALDPQPRLLVSTSGSEGGPTRAPTISRARGRPPLRRGRWRTCTARATRSQPGSPSGWARGVPSKRRSSSPRAAEPRA